MKERRMSSAEEECAATDHTWYSEFAARFEPGVFVVVDWCIRCGEIAGHSDKPSIFINGKRRGVENVEPPEGLL